MKRRKKIISSHLIVRTLPVNLRIQDLSLFENALTCQIPDVFVNEIRNAVVLRNTIFQPSQFKFYYGISHILPINNFREWLRTYRLLLPKTVVEHGIWIIDEWSSEYYHWFTDALPRLVVAEAYFGTKEVVLPNNYKTKGFILESMNINPTFFNPGKSLFIETFQYASHTGPVGNSNRIIVNQLRKRFAIKDAISNKRVFYQQRESGKNEIDK